MRELFCKYLFVGKGMKLYSDSAMPSVANRRRRGKEEYYSCRNATMFRNEGGYYRN